MWFDPWSDVLRVLVLGTAAYATLVLVLRVSGKRTLGQLNAFDFVVTVALGSTLATILLSRDVSWAEGATALALLAVLAVLQFVIAFLSSRRPAFRRVVTAEPTVLLRDGRIDEEALLRQRLSRSEVLQAVRASGAGDITRVGAAVVETDGTCSVVPISAIGDASALPAADMAG